MRTLIVLVFLLLPVLVQAHGDPEKKLPWDFFVSWEFAAEFRASAFYAADNNNDFHRLLRGEFRPGDEPLQKISLVNPKDKNETVDIIFVKEDKSLILAQYYYRWEGGLITYFYCFNINRDLVWYLVPLELFPYGKKDRTANIEKLGWHFYTEHFLCYLIYTAYPVGTSQE